MRIFSNSIGKSAKEMEYINDYNNNGNTLIFVSVNLAKDVSLRIKLKINTNCHLYCIQKSITMVSE